MHVAASGHAQQLLQQLASTGNRQQAQAPTAPGGNSAEERGESQAAQAAEGEVGGRINTYA